MPRLSFRGAFAVPMVPVPIPTVLMVMVAAAAEMAGMAIALLVPYFP